MIVYPCAGTTHLTRFSGILGSLESTLISCKMDNVEVSVVIPVKNGQKYLNRVLKAVFSQETKAGFEVIIIDSGSSDETLDIARQYPVRLYRINGGEFDHGLTRNLGISKAQGRYVILLTQDAVPFDCYWMERLVRDMDIDGRVAGVYSRQIPQLDSGILARIRIKRFYTFSNERRENKIDNSEVYHNLSPKEKHHFCNFDNVSSCIRKAVWEKIPFPKTDFAEDLEWSKSALEAGYTIIYEPESIVYHSHDFSVKEWYERNRVNYCKLRSLFGTDSMNNISDLLISSFVYTIKDLYSFWKDKSSFKDGILSFCLIPFFSVSCALGQYRGIRDSKRRLL